jgi:drug/metabolite transporter (DMT)-like permease
VTSFELSIVLLSAFLHALWNTATKGSRDPVAYLLTLQVISCVALAPLLWLCDLGEVPASVWGLVAATGVVHGLYSYWLSMGYSRGDLSVVYPISRSTPAVVPLLAIPLLGELVSPAGAAGIGLVVIGIWLVQSDGRVQLGQLVAPGTGYAYLTLAATVGYSLIDKRSMELLQATDWSGPMPRAVVIYVLIVLAHTPLFALLARRRVGLRDVSGLARAQPLALLGGVLASFASYALILEALRSAAVSYVVAARQMSVVFAIALAVGWLRERPTRPRVVGALATVAGVGLIALYG